MRHDNSLQLLIQPRLGYVVSTVAPVVTTLGVDNSTNVVSGGGGGGDITCNLITLAVNRLIEVVVHSILVWLRLEVRLVYKYMYLGQSALLPNRGHPSVVRVREGLLF